MFDVANWVACLNEEYGPRGTPSLEALSVSPQGALEISSVIGQPPSLDRNHFSTPRVVAESHKCDERCSPSSQRPQYPTLYRHLKQRLRRSLRAILYKGSVGGQGKRLHINVLELKAVSLALAVSKPNSVGCYGQLHSSSLHKQTRRNPLGGDVRSPVEDHDLVQSLPDNSKSETHSRLSECDGLPSVQVKPSPVNRMVTTPSSFQTDLSKVVHSSCRSICHSSEPQSSTVRISSPRPKCLVKDLVTSSRCYGKVFKTIIFIELILPIQWTIANPVGVDRPAKCQKKTSCVSTGWPVRSTVHSPDGASYFLPV